MSEETTKQCPYCAETIQAAAIVCRYCKRDLVQVPAAPAVKPATATKRRIPLLVWIVGGVVLSCVLFYGTGLNQVALMLLPPMEGQEAYIRTDAPRAIVATDNATFDAEMQAARAGNTAGTEQLLNEYRIFLVPAGTRVRVQSIDADRTRIEILDGEFAGRQGLVPPSFVGR